MKVQPVLIAAVSITLALAAHQQPATAGNRTSPPTDEQVAQVSARYNARIKELQDSGEFNPNALAPVADEALVGLDIAAMSATQIESLMGAANLHYYTTRSGEFDDRLAALSSAPTAEGARAALARLAFLGSAHADKQRKVITALLDHPSIAEVLVDGQAWSRFSAFTWFVQRRAMEGLGARLVALAPMMPESMPVRGAMGALALFDAVADAGVAPAEREPLRAKLVAVLRLTRQRFDPADPSLKNISFGGVDAGAYLDQQVQRLEGPVGRGTLLGGPAPELNFIWVSGERPWRSLADLKGKVIVLDFWATWCGPCVASFPKMREVAERYRGYNVEIIGVTSIQGRHHGDGPSVDCKDNPELETTLMADYIKSRDLTWPIAFSSEPVYNPDYGVRGIPHVVLIDTQGKVRRMDLRFHGDLEAMTGEIDALLAEAGHRAP